MHLFPLILVSLHIQCAVPRPCLALQKLQLSRGNCRTLCGWLLLLSPPSGLVTRFDFDARGQSSHNLFRGFCDRGLAQNSSQWTQDSDHERECIHRSPVVLHRQRSASTAFRGFRPGRFLLRRFWAARPVRSVSSSSSSSTSSSRSLPPVSRPSSCFRARNH